jgi:glycerol-3-phosphate acyltransferase PlsY
VGAAIALCPYAGMILPPFVLLAIFLTGYASVASLLTALLIPSLLYLASRLTGLPLEFAGYGAATCLVIMWALRPNIVRLCAGQERRVSLKWGGERSLRERGD